MNKRILQIFTAAVIAGAQAPCVLAQNDFFGGNLPSSVPSAANPPATAGGAQGGGDYTDDEKRMQKKYKSSIQHAKDLVGKGDSMMKKGESRHNDKMYKKGKILKEIGEKQLAELQANNPFPEDKEPKDGKESKDKKAAAP
jgi:hypothetical protein